MTDFRKIIGVLGVIAGIGNIVFGIANHNFSAVMGWSIASIYIGMSAVEAFLES